jgi:hypothetical protein
MMFVSVAAGQAGIPRHFAKFRQLNMLVTFHRWIYSGIVGLEISKRGDYENIKLTKQKTNI